MKLMYEITVFPQVTSLNLYLISNLFAEVLIRGQCFKRGRRLFQSKGNTSNFKFLFLSFSTMKIKHKTSKPKRKKKWKHQNIHNSFIVWVFVKPYYINSYQFQLYYYYHMIIFLFIISAMLAGVMLIGGKLCF